MEKRTISVFSSTLHAASENKRLKTAKIVLVIHVFFIDSILSILT